MSFNNINILLADDDKADCLLFKDDLEELPVSAMLTIAYNGKEITKKGNKFTDGLFMNLNMPRKNGYATLGEIKRNTYLQSLHVITFSTASGVETVKNVFRNVAHYYMCKPPDFSQMKKVIYEALTLIMQKNNALALQEKFLITGDSIIIPNKK